MKHKMIFIPPRKQTNLLYNIEGFWMDETPVTVAQYREAVIVGGCSRPINIFDQEINYYLEGRENHPVNFVNYFQACAYARWAGKRLPTEEEWVWAARGGPEGRRYPWGSDMLDGYLPQIKGTVPVGTQPKYDTYHGLKDVAGNVMEWTGQHFYIESDLEPQCGRGFTASHMSSLECSNICYDKPFMARRSVGFRCAKNK